MSSGISGSYYVGCNEIPGKFLENVLWIEEFYSESCYKMKGNDGSTYLIVAEKRNGSWIIRAFNNNRETKREGTQFLDKNGLELIWKSYRGGNIPSTAIRFTKRGTHGNMYVGRKGGINIGMVTTQGPNIWKFHTHEDESKFESNFEILCQE